MIIWLASYPRSGNTFVRTIFNHAFNLSTYSLYNDHLDIGASQNTQEVVGHAFLPKDWSIDEAKKDQNLWLVKTHDYPSDDEKAIYILRDGREVCVSYRKYLKNYLDQDVDLNMVISGFVPFGSWSNHIAAWQPKSRKNTLLIQYEDLLENTAQAISKIGEFIGIEPAGVDIPSFSQLNEINPKFFNSGRIDSWKEQFSEENSILFWALHRDAMLEFGYYRDARTKNVKIEPGDKTSIEVDILSRTISLISNESQKSERDRLARIANIKELNQVLNRQSERIKHLESAMQELQTQLQEKYTIKGIIKRVWDNKK